MSENGLKFLNRLTGEVRDSIGPDTLAFCQRTGDANRPAVVWLGGFKSDMDSTKALALDAWAERTNRGFLRFDYSGHGRSAGEFRDGTIGRWLEDALSALRHLTRGPLILVGSSMGGWISLLVAREFAKAGETDKLAGMVLIAPAADFTEALMWAQMPPEVRAEIETNGFWQLSSDYSDEPTPITRDLIEDGRKHLLLHSDIRTHCPVHILQGMKDPDVPWQHAMLLVEHMVADPVSVTLIKDGDHRLSTPNDIRRLISAVEAIA